MKQSEILAALIDTLQWQLSHLKQDNEPETYTIEPEYIVSSLITVQTSEPSGSTYEVDFMARTEIRPYRKEYKK